MRGAQALVGVRRRHADVDDRDVGLVGAHLAQQLVGVAGLADDVEARVLEQARDARAQQHRVLGEDYAHGISALTVVPPPRGLLDLEPPVERRDAGRPARAGPSRAAGSAPPTPSSRDLDDHARRSSRVDA